MSTRPRHHAKRTDVLGAELSPEARRAIEAVMAADAAHEKRRDNTYQGRNKNPQPRPQAPRQQKDPNQNLRGWWNRKETKENMDLKNGSLNNSQSRKIMARANHLGAATQDGSNAPPA